MKKWFEPIASAWNGIFTHKLRSSLTMLGIVIGVAAVIALMSIGRGSTANILASIESMGSDLMTISPGATMGAGGFRGMMGSATTLTQEDAESILENVANVSVVAPYSTSNLQLVYGEENMNAQIIGATTAYKDVMKLELASGRFFTDYEDQIGSGVVIIGPDIVDTLFVGADPIGQELLMGTLVVRVIGVLGESESMTASTDSAVIVPLTYMQQAISQTRTASGGHIVSSIALTLADENASDEVESDITTLLRSRHRLASDDDDDFTINSVQEIAETISETSQTLTLLLGAIAAISLLVGGIGVMNIMLVSVLERTREIGVRKALGAQQHDIWIQFLLEAAFLSLGGGLIGVIIGCGVAFFVDYLGLYTTLITADIIILAVSVSVGIGLFFGFYPAWNASRLDPIEALRSE